MINCNMRIYNLLTLDKKDSYGQKKLAPSGQIKMSINLTTQAIQNDINYSGSQYVGLTFDKSISDSNYVEYGDKRLKVLYCNKLGRMVQVFMGEV